MKSYPGDDEVLANLGDKVITGLSRGVVLAAADLKEYRKLKPGWVASGSRGGLAHWIHDRIWDHLQSTLDGIDEVTFLDKEPHREVFVGLHYRMRIKRHLGEGSISTYPTPTALTYFMQPEPLPGLDEVRLTAGYLWDELDRSMGAAVLSLRDGLDKVIWMRELPEAVATARVRDLVPPVTGPTAPVIEVEVEEGNASGNSATESA